MEVEIGHKCVKHTGGVDSVIGRGFLLRFVTAALCCGLNHRICGSCGFRIRRFRFLLFVIIIIFFFNDVIVINVATLWHLCRNRCVTVRTLDLVIKNSLKTHILGVQGHSRSSMLVPPESSSAVLVMSKSVSIGNRSHARPANSGKITIS